MKKTLLIGALVFSVIALQGCLKKEDSLSEKTSAGSNDDRKVELIRWKKNIDTQYNSCISVPGREAECRKEYDQAMVPYIKEQAKGN